MEFYSIQHQICNLSLCVYSLRENGSRLILPKYNTEFAKGSSFAFVGAKIWNSIPFNTRSATSLSAFKSMINNLDVF